MVQISEVKNSSRDHRTSSHTHIKGLGLKSDGTAERQASGFVGQATAREVGIEAENEDRTRTKLIRLLSRHAVSLSI